MCYVRLFLVDQDERLAFLDDCEANEFVLNAMDMMNASQSVIGYAVQELKNQAETDPS